MKDLFIYHPGSGTVISLSDPVYLIENRPVDPDDLVTMFAENIPSKTTAEMYGYRIDNYNMTNLFFGDN